MVGLTAVDVASSPKFQRRESIGALPRRGVDELDQERRTPRSGAPAKFAVGGMGVGDGDVVGFERKPVPAGSCSSGTRVRTLR